MRRGAAVGSGPAPDRWAASDPRFLGATLPAPQRVASAWRPSGSRRCAAAAARVTAARVGLGTVGQDLRRPEGVWSGGAVSEPPLMDFSALPSRFSDSVPLHSSSASRPFRCRLWRFCSLSLSLLRRRELSSRPQASRESSFLL
jgi:hypothetical protein